MKKQGNAPKYVKVTVKEDVLIGRVLVESGDTVYVVSKSTPVAKPVKKLSARESRIKMLKKLLKEEEDAAKSDSNADDFEFADAEFADEVETPEDEKSAEGGDEVDGEAGDEEDMDKVEDEEGSEDESEDETEGESEDESEDESEGEDSEEDEEQKVEEAIRRRLARMGSRR